MSTAIPRRQPGADAAASAANAARATWPRLKVWYTNRVSRLRMIVSLIILLPVTFVYANFIRGEYRSFYVVSLSMAPTFVVGDCVVMERQKANAKLRGKVIAFISPDNPDEILTKRVVADAGDVVTLNEGYVLVNGQPEQGAYQKIVYRGRRSWRLGKNEVFVLGDNRNNSYDSIDYGPVARSNVLGVLVFRYWPVSRAGRVL